MNDDDQDPKGGNKGGSRSHETTRDGSRQPDGPSQEMPNADEGADPSEDIKKQNPGKTTTGDLAAPAAAPKG